MPKTLERPPLPADIAAGRMLSQKEAMVYLGVSKRALNDMTLKWTAEHRVPSYKYRKHRKYKLAELDWWLEKHREPI